MIAHSINIRADIALPVLVLVEPEGKREGHILQQQHRGQRPPRARLQVEFPYYTPPQARRQILPYPRQDPARIDSTERLDGDVAVSPSGLVERCSEEIRPVDEFQSPSPVLPL